jgi:prephenate dehydrogenase
VADAKLLSQFWTALGMQVVTMTPDEHDRALATISHAPHVIAAALAAATPAGDVPLAAGGWLDTTRIAAGDALLWQQILLANSDHVLASIDTFESRLAAFRRAIESADAGGLEKLLAEAKQVRDAVGS